MTMFLAFSPSKEGRRMSSPERACITAAMVPGFMQGTKASKYWP